MTKFNRSINARTNETVANFVKRHELGDANAGNFFLAKFDDYVPTLYAQLKEQYEYHE